MRIRQADKDAVKEKILDLLRRTGAFHNLSEISRMVEKAPPTILKYVEELRAEGKLVILDKKSMKLIRIKGEPDGRPRTVQ